MIILLSFNGCGLITTGINDATLTISLEQKGDVKGRILHPIVNDNTVEWIGLEQERVNLYLIDEYAYPSADAIWTTTSKSGDYFFTGVPSGLYEIKINDNFYVLNEVSAVSSAYQLYETTDMKVIDNNEYIFVGKAFDSNMVPLSNYSIRLYHYYLGTYYEDLDYQSYKAYGYYDFTTSSDGSYSLIVENTFYSPMANSHFDLYDVAGNKLDISDTKPSSFKEINKERKIVVNFIKRD